MARALLAARLNQDAGACSVSLDQWAEYEAEYVEYGDFGPYATFEAVLTRADVILSDELVIFYGSGSFLGPRDLKGKNNPQVPLAQEALFLYEIIDDYKNGYICTGDIPTRA